MVDLPPTYTEKRKSGSNTPIVYVSLYFLLLAFFIYLHSVSEPTEERVQQVIGSIDFAFKGIKQKKQQSEPSELSGDEFGLAVFHSAIKKVYETAIPLVESKISKKGDQLQFVVPASQLFANQSVDLRNTRDDLFEEASRILIKRSGVTPTDMEILMDTGSLLPSSDEVADNLAAGRLNSLVSAFLDNGVPARNVFIGMIPENSGMVYFKFYIRSSFDNQFRREEADK